MIVLINKYQDHYVAVLELNVETPLPTPVMNYFKKNCADLYYQAKGALKSSDNINLKNLGIMPKTSNQLEQLEIDANDPYFTTHLAESLGQKDACNVLAAAFISNAAGGGQVQNNPQPNEPKGVLLDMGFLPSDKIFYPVSVVETYNYPVGNQKYFVRTSMDKEFRFTSSYSAQTVVIDNQRWYHISSTTEDLEGNVMPTGPATSLNDAYLLTLAFLYQNAFYLTTILYLLSAILVWWHLRKEDSNLSILPFLLGGALALAFTLWTKNNSLAKKVLAGILIWIVLSLI